MAEEQKHLEKAALTANEAWLSRLRVGETLQVTYNDFYSYHAGAVTMVKDMSLDALRDVLSVVRSRTTDVSEGLFQALIDGGWAVKANFKRFNVDGGERLTADSIDINL